MLELTKKQFKRIDKNGYNSYTFLPYAENYEDVWLICRYFYGSDGIELNSNEGYDGEQLLEDMAHDFKNLLLEFCEINNMDFTDDQKEIDSKYDGNIFAWLNSFTQNEHYYSEDLYDHNFTGFSSLSFYNNPTIEYLYRLEVELAG